MFVLPGIAVLVAYIYLRPHEIFPALHGLGFPTVLSFALFGYLLDIKLGTTRLPRLSPLLVFTFAFFLWAMLTVGIKAPDALGESLLFFAGPIGLFFLISQGVGGVRGLTVVSSTVLVITLILAILAVHQGLSPTVCIAGDVSTSGMINTEGTVAEQDFRPCATRADCVEGGRPDQDYLCEHNGLAGTTSIGGRVRYRGVFQDPNELAWAMSMSLPFAFAWLERRPRDKRHRDRLLVGLALVVIVACNVMTRSRSGQISLIATLGVYFVRRFGWRGVGVGAVVAAPVLLMGGRSDDSSTQERLECWQQALDLFRENPFAGVGARQFTQHHYLTAHNSALLALAEMGPIGLVLFTTAIYLVFKITIQVQRDFAARPEAQALRTGAFATLAGLTGMVVSALFLSLTFHIALWIQIALAGAIQTAVWRHDPDWRMRWRWRDAAFVLGFDAALVVGITLYLRLKGV
jgi:hypothetical protein